MNATLGDAERIGQLAQRVELLLLENGRGEDGIVRLNSAIEHAGKTD